MMMLDMSLRPFADDKDYSEDVCDEDYDVILVTMVMIMVRKVMMIQTLKMVMIMIIMMMMMMIFSLVDWAGTERRNSV